jgi:hypothetical protein
MRSEFVPRDIVSPFGVAWLKERPCGGPVRVVANGRKRWPVGSYVSVKSQRSLHYESSNELHDFWHAEVDANVLVSRDQPHTLNHVSANKGFRYTPDRLDFHADGSIEIVEVKDVFEAEREPDYAEKLNIARAIYEANGWTFTIRERRDIESSPAFGAIKTIQSHRRTALTTADFAVLWALFAQDERQPWARVQESLGGTTRAFAAICALIVRRKLDFSAAGGITEGAPLRLLDGDDPTHA